ncbi:HD domain-containing protein [Streptomyces sp. HD]|uniref:HD domain-containing protein n=1 Tax=Streptomyces sp. HD TaxID=3020892 RepID=UPI00232FBE93|nr:HD domain-containing protein [Streptomyces sp. HD]MDC0766638.1 HD domain-containing protein [Streptomyces sp. HD]
MELRSVEELMDLLYACRGTRDAPGLASTRVDLHQHALQTAALLRRARPADKELQVAGLVHAIGPLLHPGEASRHPDRAADAVRPLLGERVSRLVRHHHRAPESADDDLLRLHQADEEGRSAEFDAGVLEDWRAVLELVASRNSPLGAVN